jgi:hypothetical protein
MGKPKIGTMKHCQGMNANPGGNTSEVAAKELEPERDTLPLRSQARMPESQEHRKRNDGDGRHAQMKSLCNVERSNYENSLKRKNRGE